MLVHVGVVFDVAAQRAVEVPEPVGAKEVTARSPEAGPALLFEAAPGQQHFRAAAHVKGEVLATLQVRWRLDHEQAMVVIGTGGTHERARANKGVGGHEAQAFVKGLGLGRIRHEIHHVGQSPRQGLHIGADARLVDRPLRGMARCIGQVGWRAVRTPHADLETNGKAHIVDAVYRTIGTSGHQAVAPQLIGDGLKISHAGHAINGFTNRGGRSDGRRQTGIVSATDNHRRAVEGFKTTALAVDIDIDIDIDREQAVVTQAMGTGLNVVDAKNQGIKANDVH
ncbi:hypothetical protein D9M69_513700 [compost metagenome]